MYNLIDLTDKKIIVAGASSGIGEQTAITLSRLGAQMILIARREERLKAVIESLSGEGHAYYVADLSVVSAIADLVKKIVAEQGAIDGMVYAAGISANRPLAQHSPEKVQRMFNINCFGFLEMVRQISRKGRYNPGMRIVGISSTASLIGSKAQLAYCASKAGMDGAVRVMARELADKSICINTVAPAMIRTYMYDTYLEKFGDDSKSKENLLRRQYLGLGEPVDVANAIAFLISPAARFITGIMLPVDGGLTSS